MNDTEKALKAVLEAYKLSKDTLEEYCQKVKDGTYLNEHHDLPIEYLEYYLLAQED